MRRTAPDGVVSGIRPCAVEVRVFRLVSGGVAVVAAVVGVVLGGLVGDAEGGQGGAAGAEALQVDLCARVDRAAVGGRADQRGRHLVAVVLPGAGAFEQLEGLEPKENGR